MNIENGETQTTTQKIRLENLDFVKTLLMLIIVLYHSMVFFTGGWFNQPPAVSAPRIGLFAKWLNSFHIYAFVFVSGYLFFYLKEEQGRYKSFSKFITKKARRLIIPYVFVSLLWVVPFHVAFFGIVSPYEMGMKFGLATAPSQLWFLWMLFFVFVFAYIYINP